MAVGVFDGHATLFEVGFWTKFLTRPCLLQASIRRKQTQGGGIDGGLWCTGETTVMESRDQGTRAPGDQAAASAIGSGGIAWNRIWTTNRGIAWNRIVTHSLSRAELNGYIGTIVGYIDRALA